MSTFLESRKLISADQLKGPRVYSTDLLPTLYNASDPKESVVETARALKIKILTKGVVTLNAAYLLSPLAIQLLDDYPDFLGGPSLLPAFRVDKNSLEDLAASVENVEAFGIDKHRYGEHLARLDKLITHVMPWELGNVAKQYQALLLRGLDNPNSTIRRSLLSDGIAEGDLARIRGDVSGLDFRDSINLRNYINKLPDPQRTLLRRFATASYHIVGTGVVNCETGTDLNPLSEFKAADVVLAGRDSRAEVLSDEAIFLGAFMGLALETIQAADIPSAIVDALDFKTVHQLSEALRQQGFQDKYDGLIRQYRSNAELTDTREALDRLDEGAVADVATELGKVFRDAIQAELPRYKTTTQKEARTAFYRASADLLKDFIGMVPVLSNIVSATDVAKDSVEAIEKANGLVDARDQGRAFAAAIRRRATEIQEAIKGLKVSEKKQTSLLDAVRTMCAVHSISIKPA